MGGPWCGPSPYTPAMPTPIINIDETHDPNLKSWVESANDPGSDFPIQNLPLCTFEAEHDGHSHAHHGVIIGDQVLDVSMLNEAGYFEREAAELAELLQFPYWVGIADTRSGSKLR